MQVGSAYLFLADVLQHEGSQWSVTMAQRAQLRAWQIAEGTNVRQQGEQEKAAAAEGVLAAVARAAAAATAGG